MIDREPDRSNSTPDLIGDALRSLARELHDTAETASRIAQTVPRREDDEPARPARRPFGALAGRFAVDDAFFEPLSETEIQAWNGR